MAPPELDLVVLQNEWPVTSIRQDSYLYQLVSQTKMRRCFFAFEPHMSKTYYLGIFSMQWKLNTNDCKVLGKERLELLSSCNYEVQK